jgi:hypothetical protein
MPQAPPPSPSTGALRSDRVWVPERYITVPGATGQVQVPGHWERRLPDGQVVVPPLTIRTPDGREHLIPGGVRPPVDRRPQEP